MNKILIILPLTGLSEEGIQKRKKFLTKNTREECIIDFKKIAEGPVSIESRYDEVSASLGIFKIIKEEEKNYDCFIIWCANDAVVDEARELSKKLVLGPAIVSLAIAQVLAENISIITITKAMIPAVQDLVNKKKLERKIASIKAIQIPVLDLHKDEAYTKDRLIRTIQEAIDKDGAEAVVLGCLGMYSYVDELNDYFKIPVINPANAVIKYANMLLDLNLKQSKIAYPNRNV